MLILTRRTNEAIRIGDSITLKIIEIRGNQVRLGIEAPRNIAVHREEVFDLIANQNRADAESTPKSLNCLQGLPVHRLTKKQPPDKPTS